MKKALYIVVSIIFIVGLLVGCNSEQPKVDTPPSVEEPNNDQESNQNDDLGSGESNTSLTKEGVYSGRIDNHSSEIMIDGEPVAVQIEKVVDLIEQLEEGDRIIFTYVENEHGQMVLTSIKKN